MNSAVRPVGFYKGTMSGPVLGRGDGDNLSSPTTGGAVGTMGEARIAQSNIIAGQSAERVYRGAPKQWRIVNRAEKGHVKVWMDAFNGEVYPEGATEDKATWLQPGESMVMPIEAGLHFFGEIFLAFTPEPEARRHLVEIARTIIERTGGFELETQASNPGRNAEVRVIGGPIGLPDFIIQQLDGRERAVSRPIALYDLFWDLTKSALRPRRAHEPAVMQAEAELLQARIREYELDGVIVGPNGRPVVDQFEAGADDEAEPDDEAVAEHNEPALTRPPRGRR